MTIDTYEPPECWLEITLRNGDAWFLEPFEFDRVHSAVSTYIRKSDAELVRVVMANEILQLTRIEGGMLYIPVSEIMYYALCTPEERERNARLNNWLYALRKEPY